MEYRKRHPQESRGIVVFGGPGSGKTTIAKELHERFPGSVYKEAFEEVVKPASLMTKLPATTRRFMADIAKTRAKGEVTRDMARETFVSLRKKYSPAIIAKTLIALHDGKYPAKFLIVAGIRGYDNAKYLKRRGYIVVYLKTPEKISKKRLKKRDAIAFAKAEKEYEIEQRLFSTNQIERIAHASFDPVKTGVERIMQKIAPLLKQRECKVCTNSEKNIAISINMEGLCDICASYKRNFDPSRLKKELAFLKKMKGTGNGPYDAMVGISGGKDSTATLYRTKLFGFSPLAFTFDTGYYPKHIFPRSKAVAKRLGIDFAKIDIRKYLRPSDRASYKKTADLYDEPASEELKEKFKRWYTEGRKHYSVRCAHRLPFVRTCQLCRRVVIRAYYHEAVKRGIKVVVLGVNEWAALSQHTKTNKATFSAIRTLRPFPDKPAVHVVHLPFLLQQTLGDTRKILRGLGWNVPRGEKLVESNSNSCLFARAAEGKAIAMLGFHPDATRLAREVTAGFITKDQARKALDKAHGSRKSVRQVLKDAGIL